MVVARVARLVLPVLLAVAAGCAVTHPPDYEQLADEEPAVIQATRGVMYGIAPRSWDLPDGRKVVVESERASLVAGMGFYRVDAAFEIHVGGGGPSLKCATDPAGPGLGETRFGCWDDAGQIAFEFASGEACTARNLQVARTMTTPSCWRGVLDVGGEAYEVAYAHLAKSKVVVDRVTWTDADGRVVQAADIVSGVRIELFGAGPASDADVLVLHALALHRYGQILSM